MHIRGGIAKNAKHRSHCKVLYSVPRQHNKHCTAQKHIKKRKHKNEKNLKEKQILKGINKCKLNLIPYNETDGIYQRPDEKQIKLFMKKLKNAPFPVTVRWSKGTDIDAGCGQLAISENLMSA